MIPPVFLHETGSSKYVLIQFCVLHKHRGTGPGTVEPEVVLYNIYLIVMIVSYSSTTDSTLPSYCRYKV